MPYGTRGVRPRNGHGEQIARPGAGHSDRTGDEVRPVVIEVVRHAGVRHLLGVVEHMGAADAVTGEELTRVAALILEDSLVADRVDRDDGARLHDRAR
jgi:hypothetical protein